MPSSCNTRDRTTFHPGPAETSAETLGPCWMSNGCSTRNGARRDWKAQNSVVSLHSPSFHESFPVAETNEGPSHTPEPHSQFTVPAPPHCVLSVGLCSPVYYRSGDLRGTSAPFGCGFLRTMSFPHQHPHTPPPISGQERHANDRGRVVPVGPFAVPPELAQRLVQLFEMVALDQIHRSDYWAKVESAIGGWLASPPATPQAMTCRFTHLLGSHQIVPPEVVISLGRSFGHIIDYPFPSFPSHPFPLVYERRKAQYEFADPDHQSFSSLEDGLVALDKAYLPHFKKSRTGGEKGVRWAHRCFHPDCTLVSLLNKETDGDGNTVYVPRIGNMPPLPDGRPRHTNHPASNHNHQQPPVLPSPVLSQPSPDVDPIDLKFERLGIGRNDIIVGMCRGKNLATKRFHQRIGCLIQQSTTEGKPAIIESGLKLHLEKYPGSRIWYFGKRNKPCDSTDQLDYVVEKMTKSYYNQIYYKKNKRHSSEEQSLRNKRQKTASVEVDPAAMVVTASVGAPNTSNRTTTTEVELMPAAMASATFSMTTKSMLEEATKNSEKEEPSTENSSSKNVEQILELKAALGAELLLDKASDPASTHRCLLILQRLLKLSFSERIQSSGVRTVIKKFRNHPKLGKLADRILTNWFLDRETRQWRQALDSCCNNDDLKKVEAKVAIFCIYVEKHCCFTVELMARLSLWSLIADTSALYEKSGHRDGGFLERLEQLTDLQY